MELSQPQPRPVNGGSSQGKKPTHDFLSLYTHNSNTVQDPRPLLGNYLRTHDFLQPLERIGKNNTNNGEQIAERSDIEKLPSTSSSSSVEHVLPGGIGTYTIRHISNFDQRAPKTEQSVYTVVQAGHVEKNIEISKTHSSSNFVGPGAFTLWDESTPKEMEVMANKRTTKGQVLRAGESLIRQQWSSDRPLQTCSSSSFVHRNTTNPARFNSSPPPPPPPPSSSSSKRKNQQQQSNCSFMEMMKSGGVGKENEQDDENNNYDEDDFGRSRGHSSSSLIDGKGGSGDQRANTPRSKHSATEQRRRSKINDRFQILRDLVPQNDQKRDKASFLLEVIDYIKYLQEKVNRYETSYHGWNQEPTKLTPWRNGHALGISVVDPSQAIASSPDPALVFTGKFDVNNMTANPTMFIDAQNTVEPEPIISSANKTVELGEKALPIPIPLQSNLISSFVRNGGLAQPSQRPMSDAENTSSQPQPHMWQSGQCANESPMASVALNEQEELTIEGGTISIAGTYSQGLLHNLTQALQSSGVDLTQASISVQVDLGKRAINRLTKLASGTKDHEEPTSNRAMTHTRVESSGEDSDRAPKRLRTEQC